MAIINSIILGRARGSIGNVSLSTQKGRVIARQKPSIVSNPRTKDQVKQRNKMSSALASWAMIGNVIKSGITQNVGYGSAFNTYISRNIDQFKGAPIVKDEFKNVHLIDTFATIGALPQLSHSSVSIDEDEVVRNVNVSGISDNMKAGDFLKIVLGSKTSDVSSYGVYELKESDLGKSTLQVTFEDMGLDETTNLVGVIWFESKDGKTSTTSKFQDFN